MYFSECLDALNLGWWWNDAIHLAQTKDLQSGRKAQNVEPFHRDTISS